MKYRFRGRAELSTLRHTMLFKETTRYLLSRRRSCERCFGGIYHRLIQSVASRRGRRRGWQRRKEGKRTNPEGRKFV